MTTGVAFQVFNDAITANMGLEFRASVTAFTQGGVCIYNNSCTDPGIGNLGVGGTIKGGTTTVASLPACNAAAKGTRYFVTDANATTYHSTAVGGGTNNMGVLCDGTNWYLN